MKIGYISVSCKVDQNTKNTSDTAIGRYLYHLIQYNKEVYANSNDTITVITNKNSDADYAELGVKTHKVFSKKHVLFFELLRYLRKNHYDVIHFQHEFFIYGGIINSFTITLALLLSKRRSKIVISAHHILNVNSIDKKLIKENNYNYPIWMVKIGLRLSYYFLIQSADLILVHEGSNKESLIRDWKFLRKSLNSKIMIIPHGIGDKERIPKEEALKVLNLENSFYVIFFGYVAKHKGLDLLIKAIKILQDEGYDISLIVSGGEHPKLKVDKEYMNYYSNLKTEALKLKKTFWKGFAGDGELKSIFSASDLAVFPYTTRNATSGSVTDSIAHSTPFIVSETFENIKDFDNLHFDLNPKSLADKILEQYNNNNNNIERIEDLKKRYSWKVIAQNLKDIYLNFSI